MVIEKFILNTFLKLTSFTVPYGFEDKFYDEVLKNIFPKDIQKDIHGNYFYEIGETKTIFASHLDTVSKEYIKVNHIVENGFVKTDGKTTLGADDKAGVTIMLWMIKNKVPGLYYFFTGEEVGCIGSGLASLKIDSKKYNKVISFDRRGTKSVITHQTFTRSCSDKFADELCKQLSLNGLKYEKDDGGIYTDSAEFMNKIPECTNISVGYYNEHTFNEKQDIEHLTLLSEVCISVDWDNLPIERDPKVDDYISRTSRTYKSIDGWDDDWDFDYHTKPKNTKSLKKYNYNDFIEGNKTYFDDSGELLEIGWGDSDFENESNDYSWITSKFLSNRLNKKELEIIDKCYLDRTAEEDNMYYKYLKKQITD